ncbi:hypothetical protein SAMN05192548_105735 [Paraburkholderia terricola]|uniref:Uncharacterized protein n=1 Tax=Paraburkholderia terricola TaxID=169427 RepID=A0A1M6XM64_9BURK|nr:hypothetical protein SAMN05192547_105736 [Paraburkholderia sediminicola]SHL07112.1 hypothetical protein SAMN05192548_105735 [Paraburkholderia terricola]
MPAAQAGLRTRAFALARVFQSYSTVNTGLLTVSVEFLFTAFTVFTAWLKPSNNS